MGAYLSGAEFDRLDGCRDSVPYALRECLIDEAEADVDTMTFGRIRAAGFDALTENQRELIRRAVYEQAVFRQAYGELLNSPLQSYGINGVSMSFDRTQLIEQDGTSMRRSTYALLQRTGLTYRGRLRV